MPALISELITMASASSVKTSDLLLKAMVAARRLKLTEWIEWINNELRGYPEGIEIPDYRKVRGELQIVTPQGKPVLPSEHTMPEIIEKLSVSFFYHPTADLDALLDSIEPGKKLIQKFDAYKLESVRKLLKCNGLPIIVLTKPQLEGVLAAVRLKILEWALDMDEVGIRGEGLSFTPNEQQIAQQLVPVTHIHIEGGIHGGQLMVSSPGGQQQQTVNGGQKEAALTALLPWLQQVIAQGQLQREVCAELQAELDTLKAQAASPKPKWPVIGAVAGSVRTILEDAGGGVLAGQVLGWLATLTAS